MQSEIEQLKQADALSAAVEQFGKDFPSIVKPLVTERDEYMVGGMEWMHEVGGWAAGWEAAGVHQWAGGWLHGRMGGWSCGSGRSTDPFPLAPMPAPGVRARPPTQAWLHFSFIPGLQVYLFHHNSADVSLFTPALQVYVLRKLALYGDRVVAVVGAGHLKGIA